MEEGTEEVTEERTEETPEERLEEIIEERLEETPEERLEEVPEERAEEPREERAEEMEAPEHTDEDMGSPQYMDTNESTERISKERTKKRWKERIDKHAKELKRKRAKERLGEELPKLEVWPEEPTKELGHTGSTTPHTEGIVNEGRRKNTALHPEGSVGEGRRDGHDDKRVEGRTDHDVRDRNVRVAERTERQTLSADDIRDRKLNVAGRTERHALSADDITDRKLNVTERHALGAGDITGTEVNVTGRTERHAVSNGDFTDSELDVTGRTERQALSSGDLTDTKLNLVGRTELMSMSAVDIRDTELDGTERLDHELLCEGSATSMETKVSGSRARPFSANGKQIEAKRPEDDSRGSWMEDQEPCSDEHNDVTADEEKAARGCWKGGEEPVSAARDKEESSSEETNTRGDPTEQTTRVAGGKGVSRTTSQDEPKDSYKQEEPRAARHKAAGGPEGKNARGCRKAGENLCAARDKRDAVSLENKARGFRKGVKSPHAARSKAMERDSGANCQKWEATGEQKTFKTRATVLADVVACNRSLEKDLKAKSEELEDAKRKLENEQGSKQKLQKQVQSLQANLQDAQTKLQRSQEIGEKLRLENKKKTELVEKLERTISHMEDRIRNLEIRASEVEKAELTLESTRRNLENSQHECRAKEGEIARLQDKYDKVCLDLEVANNTIKDLEKKIEDLKHQVRHELMKNENIERGLETIPLLKDDIADRDKRIAQLEKEIEDKSALLTASRKAVREYKDRIRELEREEAAGASLRRELEVAQQEVATLKQLIGGKDALLLRKCQALEQAKLIIESLPRTQDEKEKMKKIQQLLTKLASVHNDNYTHTNGVQQQCDVNGNRGTAYHKAPFTTRNRLSQEAGRGLSVDASPFDGDTDYSLLERCLQENQAAHNPTTPTTTTPTTTQTAVVHPVRRSASFAGEHGPTSRSRQSPRPQSRATVTHATTTTASRPGTSNIYRPETRAGSRFPPSLDYPLGGAGGNSNEEADGESWAHVTHHHWGQSPRPKARPYSAVGVAPCSDLAGSQCSLDTDSETGSRDEQALARMQLTARQKDEVLAAAISVGDRVSFTVPQKPPRYGRKKPKPIVYTGIVKYVGRLDKEQYDARIYCGIRLDEPIGEKDGVYRGKRYMFTPQNHAKFFKIRDVTSILDVKSGQYLPASRLLLKHLRKSQSFHREELYNGTM